MPSLTAWEAIKVPVVLGEAHFRCTLRASLGPMEQPRVKEFTFHGDVFRIRAC